MKQLTVLEQELFSMIKLSETQKRHPNIVQYLGLSFDNDKILRIYEEFVLGANFSSYLSENLPIEMGQLKHYSANILEALGTIHILRKHLQGGGAGVRKWQFFLIFSTKNMLT